MNCKKSVEKEGSAKYFAECRAIQTDRIAAHRVRTDGSVSELIYAGVLDLIQGGRSGDRQTTYLFSRLTLIDPPQPITRLTLKCVRRPLSADFIRPYAICLTPPFLRDLLQRPPPA